MYLTALLTASAIGSAQQPAAAQAHAVVVQARRILPSVGLMNDHLHARGELMIGVRYQHFDWGGSDRHGTRRVSDEELMDAGYMMRATKMTMDMAMLDLMYGVTDDLTVTLSPQYVWNRMRMVALDPMSGMMPGETSKESFHGVGDTLASASLRLRSSKNVQAHVTLGVWIPTGNAGLRNADDTFTEYNMQTGSGTWDIEPSATATGQAGSVGWGFQASYRFRGRARNREGYRLGNRGLLTAWLSYQLAPLVSTAIRAELTQQGRFRGAYDGPAFMGMPEDDPVNSGGKLLTGAISVNWKPALGMRRGPQFGVELGLPLYQRVYGIQLRQRWQVALGAEQFF